MQRPVHLGSDPCTTSGDGLSHSPSVLIVDDDEVLRERLGRALRARGWRVVTASDPATGQAAARVEPTDCALIDLKMPGGSGLDLVRALKALHPQAKVIVFTGYGSIATALDAVRLGAAHYLSKPADADEIIAAFDRAAGGGPTCPAAAPDTPSLARAEWEHIDRVLSDSGGNISEAARRLAITRRTLQLKLKKHPPRELRSVATVASQPPADHAAGVESSCGAPPARREAR